MNLLCNHLKRIALFLAVTFLMQSCMVYTYKAATLDEAVKTNNKDVKLKSDNNETYKFEELGKKNGVYYGIAKNDSKTAKKLSDQITYEDEFNYVKILLKDEQLNEVYLKKYNKTLSTILPYAIPVLVLCFLVGLYYITGGYSISGGGLF